ncbi:MAG: hypothetical protein K0U54_05785 [Bacteroidetes bacterium]|nr:hypothetical protein [Bacteroidota bacterium]
MSQLKYLCISLLVLTAFFKTAQSNEIDVRDKVILLNTQSSYDRRAQSTNLRISILNISSEEIKGPIKLVLQNISSDDVSLLNPDGTIDEFSYVNFDLDVDPFTQTSFIIPNKTSKSNIIKFHNPKRLRFTYNFRVLSGEPADTITGNDTNNNGIWDYVDEYIDSKYPTPSAERSALQQTALAFQQFLLDADDPVKSLENDEKFGNALGCLFDVFPLEQAGTISDEIESVIVNTQKRSDAYLKATDQLSGHSSTIVKSLCKDMSHITGE